MKKYLPAIIVALMVALFVTDISAKGTKRGNESSGIAWIGDVPAPAVLFNAFCNHRDRTTYSKMEKALFNHGYVMSQDGMFILEGKVEIRTQWFPRNDIHDIEIWIVDPELKQKYYKALAAYLKTRKVGCSWKSRKPYKLEFIVECNSTTRNPKYKKGK